MMRQVVITNWRDKKNPITEYVNLGPSRAVSTPWKKMNPAGGGGHKKGTKTPPPVDGWRIK